MTAFRNSSLQGAYFIISARLLGLDCGPMSGFDNEGLDKEFFNNTIFSQILYVILVMGIILNYLIDLPDLILMKYVKFSNEFSNY